MPTVGIYVPMNVARAIAERWRLDVNDIDFQEVVRNVCAQALDESGGISHNQLDFSDDCANRHLHQDGYRCRMCGGS